MSGKFRSTRTTHTGIIGCLASCTECSWESEARNSLGNAARHADATGHDVRVEETRVIIYNKKAE